MKPTTLTQTLIALLALAVLCAPAAAQNRPSSDLLLPYFEVDAANPGGLTTLFAVGNATKKPVDVVATVHTNWGIPILEVPFTLQPQEVRTFNLRDWFRQGGNPGKALAAVEIQHLGAAASGQRSPKDNLYYSSEVRPDLQVGYVILRTQGNRPDALWGDWFNVDVAGNLARGDVLANIDRSNGCPGLCQRHLLRYLSGGGFDGGTEIIIWRENQGKPSASPVPAASLKEQADATAFDEPGLPIENRQLSLLPVEKVLVSELDFKEPFGSLDLISEAYTFIAVQHTADNRYSVGLTTYCLERETPPGPGIEIVKLTNGEDANAAPGPSIPIGGTVTWEYLVTNTGDVELTAIEVVDDREGAIDCPDDTLAPGESMTCTATGKAEACQYANVGTASGLSALGPVEDADPSHYFGDDGAELSIASIKVNGQDAQAGPSGPGFTAGDTLNWAFEVKNSGKVALSGIQISGINATCARTQLGAGESTTCTATGKAEKGEHSLPVSAKGNASCSEASASGTGYYHTPGGIDENPKIKIVKLTNGQDGASIPAGSPITWTYQVTNTGDVALSNVAVTDDKGVAVTCPKTSLAVGESMTCTGSGVAQACDYENLGKVTAKSPLGTEVKAEDPSSYFGTTQPGISIETAVNGQDADSPKGPEVAAGSPVSFSYVVKNTGNVALTGIQVSDSKGVSLSCPKTTLAAGESMTCTGSGTAQSGQYAAVGSVTGTGACGQTVSDDDPVHYFGGTTGSQGCTPGYWKNHEDSWPAAGYSTGQSVSSVFAQASLFPSLGSSTLLQALSFDGGSTLEGAAGNLLRAATAGLLNTAHSGVDYPWVTAQLISEVNAALASLDRDTILGLASVIDRNNNLGCPLN